MTRPILLGQTTPSPIEPLLACKDYVPPVGSLFDRDNAPQDSACADTRAALRSARLAAEAHRRARHHIQGMIKPGMSLLDIANEIENCTRTLLGAGYNGGIGFPTGLSLNECAAHDTPNPRDPPIYLKETDVLKVDFGTHVDGYIIDSAFTVAFDPVYEPLLQASKEATDAGVRRAGPDAVIREIGEVINEVIESYEMEVNGRPCPIRPVVNLNGHSIERYAIHGGKTVPIIRNSREKGRMESGEFFAIETFASTGAGYIRDGGQCSHYMLNPRRTASIQLEGSKKILKCITANFHTLPFCPRYIEYFESCNSLPYVRNLAKLGVIEPYPPLVDKKGSFVSQFEHTLFIGDNTKEILTAGDDY